MDEWKDGCWVVGDLYDGGNFAAYTRKAMHAMITVNSFLSDMIDLA